MKFIKQLFVCTSALLLLLLVGCKTGNFASSGGKEDISYISIISSDKMANKEVEVKVDSNISFIAKVQKAKQNKEKHNGKLYAIKPGRRHIEIYYQGNKIYSQEVFLSSQQTKTINL